MKNMMKRVGATQRTLCPWLLPMAVASSASLFAASTVAESSPWTFDATLYGLAAGMSGDVGVGGIDADLDVGFDTILENLDFGAMGRVRVGYERWSLTTDVIYMGLSASKRGVEAEIDQWVVEPSVGYQVCRGFEVLAGVRYNNISGALTGPGVLPVPRVETGTQDWWDPIVGANVRLPFAKQFSFNLRGDVGGFGAGSDLTWQAFPSVSWQFSQSASVEAGYRWVSVDYETGSGRDRFKYDMLTQGPQIGFTYRF